MGPGYIRPLSAVLQRASCPSVLLQSLQGPSASLSDVQKNSRSVEYSPQVLRLLPSISTQFRRLSLRHSPGRPLRSRRSPQPTPILSSQPLRCSASRALPMPAYRRYSHTIALSFLQQANSKTGIFLINGQAENGFPQSFSGVGSRDEGL